MSEITIAGARAAYELVRNTADALHGQYDQVVADLNAVEKNINVLPRAYLPLEDFKAGIIEFVEASGDRYGTETIRELITTFATGSMRSMEGTDIIAQLGKPLRYCDLEDAISNADGRAGRAQLLTSGGNGFDDRLMYFLFTAILREKLQEVMDAMPSAAFGYEKIQPDDIGSPRNERRQTLANLRIERVVLQQQKAEISRNLREIGFPIHSQKKEKA